ncbi:response regulator transcription factor [uncultured Sphingorhabdus sp.]|uniref:response regulator transcription factor n=1 Tax=uncultured Sphingorhabdus sp. TaxID=1686106 RepID=UPI0026081EA7|nr:response regulator transcription factor [uncultured Sphingorhabdus sp.]HMS20375.1 response regulator transcription factor [Sphingorhabdus sp.]
MRIAIADDDKDIVDGLERTLGPAGYPCVRFSNGRDLITALARETFDLVLVDWNMPEQSGMEVVYWARRNLNPCPPIIMMTTRSSGDDVVRGLEAGADDYIIKPETHSVVLARVRSALRRAKPQQPVERFYSTGGFDFDRSTNTVNVRGKDVTLTPKEFALAELFFENRHRPLSRGYILQAVWNSVADLPTRTLDMHVSRVRSKLMLKPEHGFRLQTVFGFGYRFEQFGIEE